MLEVINEKPVGSIQSTDGSLPMDERRMTALFAEVDNNDFFRTFEAEIRSQIKELNRRLREIRRQLDNVHTDNGELSAQQVAIRESILKAEERVWEDAISLLEAGIINQRVETARMLQTGKNSGSKNN